MPTCASPPALSTAPPPSLAAPRPSHPPPPPPPPPPTHTHTHNFQTVCPLPARSSSAPVLPLPSPPLPFFSFLWNTATQPITHCTAGCCRRRVSGLVRHALNSREHELMTLPAVHSPQLRIRSALLHGTPPAVSSPLLSIDAAESGDCAARCMIAYL